MLRGLRGLRVLVDLGDRKLAQGAVGRLLFLQRRVQQLLTNPNRVYTLSQPAALANVAPRYSPQVLTEVRSILSSRSDAQLRSASLDWLYVSKSSESYSAYRDAVAHVLLERGILCGRGCVVGNLYVDHR